MKELYKKEKIITKRGGGDDKKYYICSDKPIFLINN